MAEQNFKRNIAYKLRIGDVLVGKPVTEGERFIFLELGDKKVVRVNLVGNVIEKYNSSGEKRYSFLTIDDGSGQIKLKSFGDDIALLENLNQGQTIIVIGTLRQFNNEVYISPEIVKLQEPKYLLVRKIEIEKSAPAVAVPSDKAAIRDKILEDIKNSEAEGGIFVDKIILSHREASSDIINQEIQRLLEEGIIFEPRPGKVRYLG
ncbi:MAG: OB-fold nucleic acid binding domain-containing protein [Candidatus Nanoarchaeia archaeon]|nr:OB-fold nucleic acid binding domain-containing protein [Candidatus Nanoarchaeia archaeon]